MEARAGPAAARGSDDRAQRVPRSLRGRSRAGDESLTWMPDKKRRAYRGKLAMAETRATAGAGRGRPSRSERGRGASARLGPLALTRNGHALPSAGRYRRTTITAASSRASSKSADPAKQEPLARGGPRRDLTSAASAGVAVERGRGGSVDDGVTEGVSVCVGVQVAVAVGVTDGVSVGAGVAVSVGRGVLVGGGVAVSAGVWARPPWAALRRRRSSAVGACRWRRRDGRVGLVQAYRVDEDLVLPRRVVVIDAEEHGDGRRLCHCGNVDVDISGVGVVQHLARSAPLRSPDHVRRVWIGAAGWIDTEAAARRSLREISAHPSPSTRSTWRQA